MNTQDILELARAHGLKVTECTGQHGHAVYQVEGYYGVHDIETVERLIVNQGGYLR